MDLKPKKRSASRPGSENASRNMRQFNENQERAKSSLLEREEEYKRLNAELEAKTAQLVREAEEIMTEQENFLLQSSPGKSPIADPKKPTGNLESLSLAAKFGLFDSDDDEDKPLSSRYVPATSARSSGSNQSASRKSSKPDARYPRPMSRKANKQRVPGAKSSNAKQSSAADEVAVPEDFAAKSALTHAIQNMEKNWEENQYSARDDDIMPAAAAEMGVEAQIRFLKAKLRVMQEELERLSQEARVGAEERNKQKVALKDAQEDQVKLQKTNNVLQTQIEKHKRLLEEEKKRSETTGSQVQSLRKELENLKREQKQATVAHNATEVRLNRALEDVERYKTQLHKDKHANKESLAQDQQEIQKLKADNKRLEKLKNDMGTVFKKQQKLISILKRQILHIEAAKLLSFTEDEFVKALDWGNK